MRIESRMMRGFLEAALAVVVAVCILLIWPRLEVPRLGREYVWFALGWFVVLAAPAGLGLLWRSPKQEEAAATFQAEALKQASLALGGLFVALLAAGPSLGNYKLWLGVLYLAGVTLRLAGLSLLLRAEMQGRAARDLVIPLAGAALAFLAGLLMIPWVRPELAAVWPPSAAALARPAAAALLWGGVCGAVLLTLRLWGGARRAAWLTYAALALGPGPALAVSWLPLTPLGLSFLVFSGLAVLRWLGGRGGAAEPAEPQAMRPMRLYWLLRALVLLWWGVGVAVALATAWWQNGLEELFTQSLWLRALILGGFLVTCVGLLAEYSLPLLGRPSLIRMGRDRKSLGVVLSAMALLLAFTPLLLTGGSGGKAGEQGKQPQAVRELLKAPVVLDPENPDISIPASGWGAGLTRVYLESLLINGAGVEQGAVVAQCIAVDTGDLPHIFSLRAGVDTAEWALDKRELATAKHSPARIARTWIVYAPTGEAFTAHTYLTGLYLGRRVDGLKSVSLKYVYQNQPGAPPAKLEVKRVFVR